MSPYQNHFYWEQQLEDAFFEKDLSFPKKSTPEKALFVHTSIINYQASFLDYHWSCFMEPKKMLGFLQYVFLPSAFYHWLNPLDREVKIPLDSSEGIIDFLRKFPSSSQLEISKTLQSLNPLWSLEAESLLTELISFSNRFNQSWHTSSLQLSFQLFTHTDQIASHLKTLAGFPEIFEEDYGMSPAHFDQWCRDFYHNPMIYQTFLSVLQNRIGCIS